jgi:hypothetical protein
MDLLDSNKIERDKNPSGAFDAIEGSVIAFGEVFQAFGEAAVMAVQSWALFQHKVTLLSTEGQTQPGEAVDLANMLFRFMENDVPFVGEAFEQLKKLEKLGKIQMDYKLQDLLAITPRSIERQVWDYIKTAHQQKSPSTIGVAENMVNIAWRNRNLSLGLKLEIGKFFGLPLPAGWRLVATELDDEANEMLCHQYLQKKGETMASVRELLNILCYGKPAKLVQALKDKFEVMFQTADGTSLDLNDTLIFKTALKYQRWKEIDAFVTSKNSLRNVVLAKVYLDILTAESCPVDLQKCLVVKLEEEFKFYQSYSSERISCYRQVINLPTIDKGIKIIVAKNALSLVCNMKEWLAFSYDTEGLSRSSYSRLMFSRDDVIPMLHAIVLQVEDEEVKTQAGSILLAAKPRAHILNDIAASIPALQDRCTEQQAMGNIEDLGVYSGFSGGKTCENVFSFFPYARELLALKGSRLQLTSPDLLIQEKGRLLALIGKWDEVELTQKNENGWPSTQILAVQEFCLEKEEYIHERELKVLVILEDADAKDEKVRFRCVLPSAELLSQKMSVSIFDAENVSRFFVDPNKQGIREKKSAREFVDHSKIPADIPINYVVQDQNREWFETLLTENPPPEEVVSVMERVIQSSELLLTGYDYDEASGTLTFETVSCFDSPHT